ncbi:MAG: hypothetical protein R3D98_12080 [Candidatus Krumholzibacteriia bacterium]
MQRFILTMIPTVAAAALAVAEPVTIACPAEPPVVRRLDLRERWRIDPDDPDAPLISWFDQRDIVAADGRLYLLDPQLCHILVYSSDGRHLDTILGEGDGPGEVRMPGALQLLSDGSLAVQHGYPTKLEIVDADGTPRRRWQIGYNTWVYRIIETPLGWFASYAESKESDEPGMFRSVEHVALHDDEGLRTRSFYQRARTSRHGDSQSADERDEFRPWMQAIPSADGTEVVCIPERDEYRLEWHDLNGEITRIVTRDFDAHRRTEAELDELRFSNYSIVNGDLQFKKLKLCSHDAMIRFLEWQADGSLRVRTSLFNKDLPAGMVCRYEVHEPDGRLRERVEIYDPTGDFDADYDALALLDGGRAMVLRNLMAAFRATYDSQTHPDVLAKRPPAPDDREDIGFAPVMCDLVPKP